MHILAPSRRSTSRISSTRLCPTKILGVEGLTFGMICLIALLGAEVC
jgi:hypothetical protein